jgi:hypothetical protein
VQIPPLNLYAETIALQRASATRSHAVNLKISNVANDVQPRPQTGLEKLRERAVARERDVTEAKVEGQQKRTGGKGKVADNQVGRGYKYGRSVGKKPGRAKTPPHGAVQGCKNASPL